MRGVSPECTGLLFNSRNRRSPSDVALRSRSTETSTTPLQKPENFAQVVRSFRIPYPFIEIYVAAFGLRRSVLGKSKGFAEMVVLIAYTL
jgi:hypothetical protein